MKAHRKILAVLYLTAALAAVTSTAQAEDSEFLRTLDGEWIGKGEMTLQPNSAPVDVTCDFTASGAESSLTLDGKCRGATVVSRAISVGLNASGNRYSGSYRDADAGEAGLDGSRRGNAIDLTVHWASQVNGDREALLTIEKLGQNGMRLTAIDKNPETGKAAVTSEITLERK
jgi:hypothetical protein